MSTDRFSDTKEIPIPEPIDPFAQQQQRQAQMKFQRTLPSDQPQTRPVTPGSPRQVQHPERQRMQQNRQPQAPRQRADQRSYPTTGVVRRASYQEQMPQTGKTMPYRRPPQNYRQPEFDEYEEQTEPARPRTKKKRRRKHSCLLHIIRTVVITFAVIFGLYSAVALMAIKKLEYEETGTRQLSAMANAPDPDVRNILIIGTDNRADETGRADTMILMSFSKHNRTMTMTSLMRDSYVSIPNYGTNKLNAAYAYGGPTLLMDTITNNYGIPVDDYVCVNFRAFVHIADALGGLKVEVSDSEAEAINVILQSEVNAIMGDDPMADFLPSGGTFLLNGKQALAYARIRFVGNADFERTERQREVLDLLIEKVKHPKPTAVPKILSNALPELKTNMTTAELYLLSLQMPGKLLGYDMQKLRLPADGTFSDQTSPDGQMVLAVDFDANYQIYEKAVTDPLPEEPAEAEAIQ